MPYYTIQPTLTKLYVAVLNQTGTNDPIATEFINTLGITPQYNRAGVGGYTLIDPNNTQPFTTGKTYIQIVGGTGASIYNAYQSSENQITISTVTPGVGDVDGILQNTAIEIRVYN